MVSIRSHSEWARPRIGPDRPWRSPRSTRVVASTRTAPRQSRSPCHSHRRSSRTDRIFTAPNNRAEDDFLVQAAISTLSQVVETALPDVVPRQLTGFEVALSSKPKRWFMLKSESPLLVLGRVVPMVTQEAVHTAWRDVARLSDDPGHLRCLFLMGGGLDSAENLGDVVSAERHRPARAGVGILVIPVDLTTWQSLVPSEAPDAVKAIIAGLPVTL